MLTFLDDIRELRPTIFATVPRLLNRLYAKVGVATLLSTKLLLSDQKDIDGWNVSILVQATNASLESCDILISGDLIVDIII